MLIYFEDGQASLFDQDFYAGKMSQGCSPADSPKAKIFVSFSKKLSELSSIPYLFLDLSEGVGNLLGESYWETLSPWRGMDAQYWGVPQRRKRIFLVADFGGTAALQILFDQESLFGYTPPQY